MAEKYLSDAEKRDTLLRQAVLTAGKLDQHLYDLSLLEQAGVVSFVGKTFKNMTRLMRWRDEVEMIVLLLSEWRESNEITLNTERQDH